MLRSLALVSLIFTAAPAVAQEIFEQVKIDAGQALFEAECQRCHGTDADRATYGPPLNNVLNRAAGSVADYDYSIAMEASGIVWTKSALRAWMEDNDGFMPGTKMRHVGIEDRSVQDLILAYLVSQTTQDNTAISK